MIVGAAEKGLMRRAEHRLAGAHVEDDRFWCHPLGSRQRFTIG